MPHATPAEANPSIASPAAIDRTAQHLTESILTLEQTIQNIKDDVAAGTAPSILLPADPTQDINAGMLLLTLDPSPSDISTHLTPLSTRLSTLESTLRTHSSWHPPLAAPKSPEYSIIDISDLSSAISLLENLLPHVLAGRKGKGPREWMAGREWHWDLVWKEYYSQIHDEIGELYVYLSTWRFDEGTEKWVHVSMQDIEFEPVRAAERLGSWEDWEWDGGWGEWFSDVSGEGEGEERLRVYASKWQVSGGEWVYVGRI